MWNKYDNVRRVRTLEGVVQLRLKVRRCATPECERFCQPYRPEAEGKWALPQHEFGLDVMALVDRHAGNQGNGVHATAIAPLEFTRECNPVAAIPGVSEPLLAIVIQGQKDLWLNQKIFQ